MRHSRDDATLHYRRGAECLAKGDAEGAVRHLRRAVEKTPGYAWAHQNLGQAYRMLGKAGAAERAYRMALALEPDYVAALTNLGSLLGEADRYDEAIDLLKRALALAPDVPVVRENCAAALMMLGKRFEVDGNYFEAFATYRQVLHMGASQHVCLERLARTLRPLRFTAANDKLFEDLLLILDSPAADPLHLREPIISALRLHSFVMPLLDSFGSDQVDSLAVARQLSTVPLLLRLMAAAPLSDLELEELLTRLRRGLLRQSDRISPDALPFTAALAMQCFANEYIFSETTEEVAVVAQMQQALNQALREGAGIDSSCVAILGAYGPLHNLEQAAALLDREWPVEISAVLRRQILEPHEEARLEGSIRTLTSIQDSVSVAVRDQYEANPYPLWTKVGAPFSPLSMFDIFRAWCPHANLAECRGDDEPEILVAGCGTGRQSIYIASWVARARVLAIDLSNRSLAHALRKTAELGIRNIEYAKADILNVETLARNFDFIDCTGVLHHVRDPVTGLKCLASVLRPGGVIRLFVYSRAVRKSAVERARQAISAAGIEFPRSPVAVRDARRFLADLARCAPTDKDLQVIVESPDFFSVSECRDLIFHTHEHFFDVERIDLMLRSCGLQFLGFDHYLNREVIAEFQKRNQNPATLAALDLWKDFEQSTSVSVNYTFLCQKPAQ